ncbi:MAG: tetratricopeptide repeat protein, partial [Bacteroidetes bacterium]|nr:tetratricopeptide repeat protein [Bacteroidota bacterium]
MAQKNNSTSQKVAGGWLSNSVYLLVAFIILAFVLYGNTLGHGFVLDDGHLFLRNKFVQNGFQGIGDIFSNGFLKGSIGTNDQSYRPLVLASYAIERALFNNKPMPSHFINVLLYGLCSFMVWKNARLLFAKFNAWVPVLIAFVFMTHPVHTEVVANIKGRDDILHFLFVMTALFYAIKFLSEPVLKNAIGIGFSFFLALLSKEMSVPFVVLIPLSIYFFISQEFKRLLPVFGILSAGLVVYFLIRTSVLDSGTFEANMSPINNVLAGAENGMERLASSLFMLLLYLKLLVLPHPLSWDYSISQIPLVGLGNWQTWAAIAVLLALGYMAISGLRKRTTWAWAILFFFGSIAIVSNVFILVGATMADRFLFTPSLAFAVIVVVAIAKLAKVDLGSKKLVSQTKFMAPLAIILLLYSFKTFDRNQVWESNETLYLSGVETAPNSSRTWSGLASVYRDKGAATQNLVQRTEFINKAINAYKKSIKLFSENFDSYYNLGVCYNLLNEPNKALEQFKKTIAIDSNYVDAWNNIGVYYFNNNQQEIARKHFLKVVELNPDNINGLSNMGVSYYKEANWQEAMNWYSKALAVDPSNEDVKSKFSLVQQQLGNGTYAESPVITDTANSESSKLEMALNYRQRGQQTANNDEKLQLFNAAISLYNEVLNEEPSSTDLIECYYNLGVCHELLLQPKTAIEYYEKTVELDPNNLNGWNKI